MEKRDNPNNGAKPSTCQRDLAKLPKCLTPLIERPQWAVWRWTQRPGGSWQKPPFISAQPDRHASTSDPSTWSSYAAALAAVQAGHADGISYVLTADDPFSAIDLDHCRDLDTHSIARWAQLFLERGRNTYSEVTPSGSGCRIWGLATGDKLHRKFDLIIDDKPIAAELFRRTNKALTITGYKLDTIRELTSIDRVMDWAVIWGERRKAAAAPVPVDGNGFNGRGNRCGYCVDQIEQIVRGGAPAGGNRSGLFHTVVGHYVGVGWTAEQILAHLQQFPSGIGEKYISESRLAGEVDRSCKKFGAAALPMSDTAGWTNCGAKAPQPKTQEADDPELQDDFDEARLEQPVQDPKPKEHVAEPDDELDDDPELDDDDLGDEQLQPDPDLPPMFAHGDPDPRSLRSWLIKGLIPACGHGLLSGQWGTGKTFVVFDLAAALGTGQPFLGYTVKRQCGTLLIAAEGGSEVRLRLDAVIRAKCGDVQRAPFRWYEAAPVLLQKNAATKLIAMARQAEASLLAEFGLPLGLIVVDTIAASAGYARSGDENDNAVGQAIMNVLKAVALDLNCFVLGVDHFGKTVESGTRGAYSKESAGDVVLACLGDKELSGSVTNTRLAVRKNRSGQQGQEFPFQLRLVQAPEPDEDGEAITTMVVDWVAVSTAGTPPPRDPWAQSRRQDQRTAVLRLKRVLMAELAEQGVELPIPPDGPVVRLIDQDIVRERFYACTPAEGTPEQKGHFRRQKFLRALDRAEQDQLIGVGEIGGITYLWLSRADPVDEGEEDQD